MFSNLPVVFRDVAVPETTVFDKTAMIIVLVVALGLLIAFSLFLRKFNLKKRIRDFINKLGR